jgi:hypothetical protein
MAWVRLVGTIVWREFGEEMAMAVVATMIFMVERIYNKVK